MLCISAEENCRPTSTCLSQSLIVLDSCGLTSLVLWVCFKQPEEVGKVACISSTVSVFSLMRQLVVVVLLSADVGCVVKHDEIPCYRVAGRAVFC